LIGSVLGNYRISQKLGQGGVGEVWKALDLTLDREVALKILRPELAAVPELVSRFRTEALALARLSHSNVATIHGFHTEGDTTFIVMEYIPGQTLDALVRSFGPMRCQRALPLFGQVLDAIGHAHEHGLVHRDLKASNVMLTHLGAVKMLDFGIARFLGSPHLTKDTHSIGTPAWMAPEQIRGEEADARTDVYGLGLLLYWLVAARLPFQGQSHYELERAHVEEPPPSPRQFAPDLPEAVEKAILRALAKQRDERFASAAEMRAALGEGFAPLGFGADEHTQAYEPAPGPTLVLPRDDEDDLDAEDSQRARTSRWLAVAALALLALVAGVAVQMLREPDTAPIPQPSPLAPFAPPVVVAPPAEPAQAEPAPAVPAPPTEPVAATAPDPAAAAAQAAASEPVVAAEETAKPAPPKPARANADAPPAAPAPSEDGWVIRRQ
jgi:serine/threonine-protein kinase